jgi:hypothetical protein
MAVKVLNPAQRIEYVLTSDRESDAPTIFVLRPLTWEQFGTIMEHAAISAEQWMKITEIRNRATAEEREISDREKEEIGAIAPSGVDLQMRLNRQYAVAVELGVTEIRGLVDRNGSPLPLAPGEFARCASPEMLGELYDEIARLSTLTENDRKN